MPTLEQVHELEEAERRIAELRKKFALTTDPPAPARPVSEDAWRKDVEARLKSVEGSLQGIRTELWKEWSVVQDQIRAELHRTRDVPVVIKNGKVT